MKQLDDDAQRALVFAADEARDMGHTRIGTEHMLLGLVRLGDTRTREMGLSLDRTREDVLTEVGGGRGRRTIGELLFTDPARQALVRAREQAGPGEVNPADLLEALLADVTSGASKIAGAVDDPADELLAEAADPGSVVARALMSLGVDEEHLREAVDRVRRGAAQI